jgi:hypothetical protein
VATCLKTLATRHEAVYNAIIDGSQGYRDVFRSILEKQKGLTSTGAPFTWFADGTCFASDEAFDLVEVISATDRSITTTRGSSSCSARLALDAPLLESGAMLKRLTRELITPKTPQKIHVCRISRIHAQRRLCKIGSAFSIVYASST